MGLNFFCVTLDKRMKLRLMKGNTLRIFTPFNCCNIKTLPISWADPMSSKDSIPRERETEDGITLSKNIFEDI